MTQQNTVEAQITVERFGPCWRAVVYLDGKAVKMSPGSPDRDVAVLYANYMEDIARDFVKRTDGEIGGK